MCDVLVVDDDTLIRTLVAARFEDAGLSVHSVGCLRDARDALDGAGCRILVVDHDLGEIDGANGFDFGRAALAAAPHLGVIYVSGRWEMLEELRPGRRERNLPKPFRVDHLLRLSRELLDGPG